MPAAIVIGSGLIATGLYFGLRAQGASPSSTGPTERVGAVRTGDLPVRDGSPRSGGGGASRGGNPAAKAAPATAHGLAMPRVAPGVRARVTEQATAMAAELQAAWTEACAKGKPTGDYRLSLSFSPQGKVIASGFSEERGRSDPEVGRCLRLQQLPPPISVDPPGVAVAVEIPVTLP